MCWLLHEMISKMYSNLLIIYHNCEIIDNSQTIEELYHKKLSCGYRRPTGPRQSQAHTRGQHTRPIQHISQSHNPDHPIPVCHLSHNQGKDTTLEHHWPALSTSDTGVTSEVTTSAPPTPSYKSTTQHERGFPVL